MSADLTLEVGKHCFSKSFLSTNPFLYKTKKIRIQKILPRKTKQKQKKSKLEETLSVLKLPYRGGLIINKKLGKDAYFE